MALGGISPQQRLAALLAECPGEKAQLSWQISIAP